MKKIVLILFIVVVSAVASAEMTAAQGRAISENGLFMIALNDIVIDTGKDAGIAYVPERTYEGVFEKYRIYSKRFSTDFWNGTGRPAKIFSVKCQNALSSLSTIGTWTGNLNSDGSCGPVAEPADWATGNYLNYQAQLNGN